MERKVYFDNSKGDRLCGIINNPIEEKENTIVILVHGFASNKNGKTHTTFTGRLAKHKISTFRFDLYGRGESDGKFGDITTSEAVDDVLQASKFLRRKGYNKIGLMGSSFGGLACFLAAPKIKGLYVLTLNCPVSNYYEKELGSNSNKELEGWKRKGYKIYETNDGKKYKLKYAFFEDSKKNDGYKAAPKIKAPTLIVHGDKDITAPYNQSVKTCRLISNCKLYTIKGADHGFSKPKDREEMYQAIEDFIVEKS